MSEADDRTVPDREYTVSAVPPVTATFPTDKSSMHPAFGVSTYRRSACFDRLNFSTGWSTIAERARHVRLTRSFFCPDIGKSIPGRSALGQTVFPFFFSMTHELISTSVSKGLKPGSSGFCTVGRSEDIPPALEAVLESPPDYRHLHPPESSAAPLNPVAYSHRFLDVEGTVWHILSRTCNAGIDFSLRSNRLVHQIACSPGECTAEGPAWIFAQDGVFMKEWVGPSLLFPKGRRLPTRSVSREPSNASIPDIPPMIDGSRCPFWQIKTGDSGWAGILAETLYTGREAVLVYNPGTDLRPFLCEAIALLPPEARWKTTFDSFYVDHPERQTSHSSQMSRLPQAAHSFQSAHSPQWKGVVRGTPEERRLAQQGNLLFLDLTRPLGEAPAGAFSDFARGGSVPRTPGAGIFSEQDGIPADGNDFSGSAGVQVDVQVGDQVKNHGKSPGKTRIIGDNTDPNREDSSPPIPPGLPSLFAMPESGDSTVAGEARPAIIAPPIIVPTSIAPPVRPGTGLGNRMESFLAVPSRWIFYSTYAAAMLVVLVLFLLLVDQQMKWGYAASVRRSLFGGAAKTEEPPTPGEPSKPGELPQNRPTSPDLDADGSTEENTDGKSHGEKAATPGDRNGENRVSGETFPANDDSNLRQAASRKVEEQERLRLRQEEFQRRRSEQRAIVDEVLEQWEPPKAIALPIPMIGDEVTQRIDKPDPLTVGDFAPLHRVGNAITIGILPYLETDDWTLSCRELGPDVQLETITGRTTPEPADIANVERISTSPERPGWVIMACHPRAQIEYPFCLLLLDAAGLSFEWLPDALTPQNFPDAGRVPFSLLTVGPAPVDAEPDGTEGSGPGGVRTETAGKPGAYAVAVPLFKPISLPAVPLTRFQKEPEIDAPTLFLASPWNVVFENGLPVESMELRAEISPEKAKGLRDIVTTKENPLKLVFELNSDQVTDQSRLNPVATWISAAVSEGRFVLRSEHGEQLARIADKIKDIDDSMKEKRRAFVREQQKMFIAGKSDAGSAEGTHQAKEELDKELGESEQQKRELGVLLERIPEARDRILAVPELKLDLSLFLRHGENDPPLVLMSTQ